MKKLIELNIQLSGPELATEFCNLDEVEQAAFFNGIAKQVETWTYNSFAYQMSSVDGTGLLTKAGRDIMRVIGKYSDVPAYKL